MILYSYVRFSKDEMFLANYGILDNNKHSSRIPQSTQKWIWQRGEIFYYYYFEQLYIILFMYSSCLHMHIPNFGVSFESLAYIYILCFEYAK